MQDISRQISKKKDAKLIKAVANTSVITASTLILAKLIAWIMTGSVSILATLIDSIFDAISSLLNRIAIQISVKPADENHHFGHHKAEQLAALAQAAFISGSAVFLILHAINDLRTSNTIQNENIALFIMIFSMICTSGLLFFQHYVVKKTGSTAIEADSLHYKMDLLSNGSVIIALLLSLFGYEQADAIFGILIAIYMLKSVTNLAIKSIQTLMDQALPPEDIKKIRQCILEVQDIIDVHNVRTRGHSSAPTILLDLDLDSKLSLLDAYNIGTKAKQAVLGLYPNADIFIHLDPYIANDK